MMPPRKSGHGSSDEDHVKAEASGAAAAGHPDNQAQETRPSMENHDELMSANSEQDLKEPPAKKKKDDDEPQMEAKSGPVVSAAADDSATANNRSPELSKLWKAVNDDAADFAAWTSLLQFVDGQGNACEGREAFDAFLFRYPYCYGYWKKYADFEKRKGSKEKCMMVFERGIKAIPLSADLWLHYLNHVRSEYADQLDFIRTQYERAVEACGQEWRSDKLWDHYVKWELSLRELRRTLNLYDRILHNPTQGLSHQFDMFRDFVKEHNPKDILEASEFLSMRKEWLASKASSPVQEDDVASEDAVTEVPGKVDLDAPASTAPIQQDEESAALREKIVATRKKIFKEAEEKVHARYKYEENVKRPYFHMKPLERGQLKNWSDYLDFEMKQGDPVRIEILFERCLIACALYVDFWLKYIDWLQRRRADCAEAKDRSELVDKIRDVFQRACTHHLPTKVEIHFAWSAFEESHGDLKRASEILSALQTAHPDLLSLVLRQIQLELRRGNRQQVEVLYKNSIDKCTTALAVRSDLSIKYSRYLRLLCGEECKAVQVLQEALKLEPKNPKLYLQLIDVYVHQRPLDVAKIVSVFDAALSDSQDSRLSDQDRFMFAARKVQFLEDFGANIDELLRAQDEHKKLSYSCDLPDLNRMDKTMDASKNAKAAGSGQSNGAATSYEAANSASYAAQHASQYQQYGSRYAGYQAYGQYPSYYQGYSGGTYGAYGAGY